MASPPKSLGDYLRAVSPVQRAALQKVRQQILSVVPTAQECISYSMPAFRVRGHTVAGFAATTKGCSYVPFSGTTLDAMAAELTGYSRTKSALHFDPERGLSLTLVRQLIKARLAELPSSASTQKTTSKRPAKKKAPAENEPAATRKRRG